MAETQPSPVPAAATPAVIVAVEPELEARVLPPASARFPVRVAIAYTPSVGDRVLLVSDGRESYVIGVLHAREVDAGGVRAVAAGDALEVRDGAGRLLARFKDGAAEIETEGDLSLTARGHLRLRSEREVTVEAPVRIALDSDRLELRARHAELAAARADAVVGSLSTTARRIATNAERIELTAERIVERAHSVLHEVQDVLEQRAGKVRTLVARAWSLRSQRTRMRSEDDTTIEGKKILLG
jgi:hypothetical protein